MRLSTLNRIKDTTVAVHKGQAAAHVGTDIGKGVVMLAASTNEAVDELDLKPGDEAYAVIKASDVMVGKQ